MRRNNAALIAQIVAADGSWVTISAEQVAGRSTPAKRVALHNAAQYHGVRIQVRTKNGLEARLATGAAESDACSAPNTPPADLLTAWNKA